jgi:hypothetical protein
MAASWDLAQADDLDLAGAKKPAIELAVVVPSATPRVLQVRMTLKSEEPVLVARAALPWESPYSLVLVAVRPNGRPVDRVMTIADAGYDTLTIHRGQTLSGSVDLDRRFHGLAETLHETEVILFWSYQLSPVHGVPADRLGGWLVLPKR